MIVVHLLGELQERSLRPPKVKNCKVHVKKPTTLLNTYYFTSIFQGISLLLNFN